MRVVRLVTSVAKHSLGVRNRLYLGKSYGLGGVFFMAAPTEIGYIGQLGYIGDGVVRMFGQGTMAGLATNSGMLPPTVHLGFFIVAGGTLASTGVGNWKCADHVKRARPVVSVLPKVLGHHGGTEDQENPHRHQQDQPGTYQMSRIPEKTTQCHPPNKKIILSSYAVGEGPSAGRAVASYARLGPSVRMENLPVLEVPLYKT